MKVVAIDGEVLTSLLSIKDKEAYILRMQQQRKGVEFASLAEPKGSANSRSGKAANEEKKYVAVIPIIGVMTRYGDMCSYGTETLSQWIKQCNNDSEIAGIVLQGDTPGGEANGCKIFSDIIRDSTKPIVGLVQGMVCSAGVFAFSGCDYIMMEPTSTSKYGSIGVLCIKETWKGEKVSYEIIRAKGSEKKALFNSIEDLSEEERQNVIDELTAIRQEFIQTVKDNRLSKVNKAVPEEAFSGDTWGYQDAIRLNLVDGTGLLEDAIQKVFEISNKRSEK